jgi:formylglycine-generating enzyme required for sulfatase activity
MLSAQESPDNLELTKKLHELIVKTCKDSKTQPMADYSAKVPKTGAAYHMVAVKGGEFLMGSQTTEADRQDNEGPQSKVSVKPFWIGKYEVTWDEYEPFMVTTVDRRKNGARIDFDPKMHTLVDAVSQPTAPYTEMSFGMGQRGYPAISMTLHAANKYCQWLSAQTGHFYRLPTEAEWEYACRAGTTTAYSFGDDPEKLGEFAWYYENSNEKYQKVGQKKPNPWGLYDMHGNVMEWTADQYLADYFTQIKTSPSNPYIKPTSLYPQTVRGGGWDDDPEQLRSAYRRGSEPDWKIQDPQLPKSIWYHTDAQWLGLRIIRPLEIPSVEEMHFYWNSAANLK